MKKCPTLSKHAASAICSIIILTGSHAMGSTNLSYTIVDTGQTGCYDNNRQINCPLPGKRFYGQDSQFDGNQPAYKDNGDGTISDLTTGLMWARERGEKMTWDTAVSGAADYRLGGYNDWRLPTIKELYSLIDFRGGSNPRGNSIPYIDTNSFEFKYGDEAHGERSIDCQDWSATGYVGTSRHKGGLIFGVNFADGRIKGYPKMDPRKSGGKGLMYVRYVRGNQNYGKNDFLTSGNGTISDISTGLMWTQADSGKGMNWQEALAWVQEKNNANYLGHDDWRLPNAKELQSIVDYSRAPLSSDSSQQGAAIDPLFSTTQLSDGEYPFFWTGTTHLEGPTHMKGSTAVYLAFGRATGWMPARPGRPGRGGRLGMGQSRPGMKQHPGRTSKSSGDTENLTLIDIHGAGAQRSDPKAGNPNDFPYGRGPQGDVLRIYNFVRLVRDLE